MFNNEKLPAEKRWVMFLTSAGKVHRRNRWLQLYNNNVTQGETPLHAFGVLQAAINIFLALWAFWDFWSPQTEEGEGGRRKQALKKTPTGTDTAVMARL